MDPPTDASPWIARCVARDVQRASVLVGAVDAQQAVVLTPRRVDLTALAVWLAQHLTPTDAVVREATTNAWTLDDQMEGHIGRVAVVSPTRVKRITPSTVKTDARATLKLARLLAADLRPAIGVPPHHVRALRALVASRERLVRQRTQAQSPSKRAASPQPGRAPGWPLLGQTTLLVGCAGVERRRDVPGPPGPAPPRRARSADRRG
jgi:hypothetical protein